MTTNECTFTVNKLTTKLIKLPDVVSKTGKKSSSIYSMIAKNEFPKPVKIGKRASAWVESEIDEWIQVRISKR